MLVSSELELKPVPKRRFVISTAGSGSMDYEITTSFSGTASLDLPPGGYTVRSVAPLEFGDRSITWSVEFIIQENQVTGLELSNDNAEMHAMNSGQTRVVMDEGELYKAVKSRVYKVLSGSGHGSGFLVNAEHGLVATNHHVIAQSDYLAVKIDPTHKYPARVVATDEINDVAILQIAPSVVSDQEPLQLAEETPKSPPYEVGDRVVAVGSPLATETILTSGLVSKIEAGAIYSDVNINPGNSGGPLFDSRGQVIGISTFGVPTSRGPGISGIIRVHLVSNLLRQALQSNLTEHPAAELLPVESTFTFPAEQLREQAISRSFDARRYHIEAGKFDVQLLTPVLIAGLEVSAEKLAAQQREKRTRKRKQQSEEYAPGQDFYEWRRYAGDYRPVITLQAIPEIKLTAGSAFAVLMAGASAPQKYKFKADFDKMELWRGDTLVRPIHPRRWASVVNMKQGVASMNDIGFYGSYDYPPEAFKPGEVLMLKVWKQGIPKPIVKTVPAEQQAQVWRDFKPYFAALEETAGN